MRLLILVPLVCCAMALILHSSKADDMKQNNAIPHKIPRAKEVKQGEDYNGNSNGMGGMGGMGSSMDMDGQRGGQSVGNGYNVDVNGMHGVAGDGMRMDGQPVGNRNGSNGNGNGMGVPAGSATTKH